MTTLSDVHSESGRLQNVSVCCLGRALKRLTPANSSELLLDEVLLVAQAHIEHDAFTSAISEHDVEGLELHGLLTEAAPDPTAGAWFSDRMLGPDYGGPVTAVLVGRWLKKLSPAKLAGRLIRGVAQSELPWEAMGLLARRAIASDFPLLRLLARVGEDWSRRLHEGQAFKRIFGNARCDAVASALCHRGWAHSAHQQQALDVLEHVRRTLAPAALYRRERKAIPARPEIVPDGSQAQRLAR